VTSQQKPVACKTLAGAGRFERSGKTTSMVRRGSTVRVRQRALQNPRSRGFSFRIDLHEAQYALGMEPFMELPDLERPSFAGRGWRAPHFEPLSTLPRSAGSTTAMSRLRIDLSRARPRCTHPRDATALVVASANEAVGDRLAAPSAQGRAMP
jgi:hypothetical protein